MSDPSPETLVYIDPVRGWHFHLRKCYMAGPLAILYKDLIKYKPAIGIAYVPCDCISGKHLDPIKENLIV